MVFVLVLQFGLGQVFMGLVVVVLQVQYVDEFGVVVGKQCVCVVGGGVCFGWVFVWVLDIQECGDYQYWLQVFLCLCCYQYVCQFDVYWQVCYLLFDWSQLMFGVYCVQFIQLLLVIGDCVFVWCFEEWEVFDLFQVKLQYLQDYVGQVGVVDFRVGEFGL